MWRIQISEQAKELQNPLVTMKEIKNGIFCYRITLERRGEMPLKGGFINKAMTQKFG